MREEDQRPERAMMACRHPQPPQPERLPTVDKIISPRLMGLDGEIGEQWRRQ